MILFQFLIRTTPFLFEEGAQINPLHPNISMHILHTILYTFPKVLTRRIC